jgi:hypothetical protein
MIMRALLVVLFLLMVMGAADAQFRPAPTPFIGGMYECAAIYPDDDSDDEDPFYKIIIYVETEASKPSGMTVEHVSATGQRANRNEQYKNASFRYEPEKLRITWTGQLKKNPKTEMTGTLMFSGGKWRYQEQLGNSRRLVTKSICHQVTSEC